MKRRNSHEEEKIFTFDIDLFPSMIILTITTDSIQTVTGIALHPKNLTKQ